jgi:predicted dienelactone hydrolase
MGVLSSYMLTNWTKHDRLDAGRIGLFGFSLGGFPTLVEISGTPDLSRMRELCAIHPTAPECLFIKQRNGDQLSPETFTPAWPHERVKAAVIAAPAVSYLFGPGSLHAGHYAFLPPCSEQLAQQAPQICTDNPSFDRSRFHREFNEEVVAFFRKTLNA